MSERKGVLLEIGDETFQGSKFERIVPMNHKTDVLDLQAFIPDKYNLWLGNGRSVEKIWKKFKDTIFKGIKCYVTQKILSKNGHLLSYNKEENG